MNEAKEKTLRSDWVGSLKKKPQKLKPKEMNQTHQKVMNDGKMTSERQDLVTFTLILAFIDRGLFVLWNKCHGLLCTIWTDS